MDGRVGHCKGGEEELTTGLEESEIEWGDIYIELSFGVWREREGVVG